MSVSRRESVLMIATLLVVVVGGTFWFGLPLLKEWKALKVKSDGFKERIQFADRLLKQRTEIDDRLRHLQESMPEYAIDTDVTSQLLKNLQRTADQHGLILIRQEPGQEEQAGELFEMAIGCSWEGDLSSLTHFLYALHSQGAMVDVRQLSAAPSSGTNDRLKGMFTVDYAYSRFNPAEGLDLDPEP